MADQAYRDQRADPRTRKTLFCQVTVARRHFPAAVLNLSASGMFVRTATSPPIGTEVEVTLRLAGGKAWNLRAEIARDAQSGSSRDLLHALGLGLKITDAPDGFADFVESLEPDRWRSA
jgi:hypothetical protein